MKAVVYDRYGGPEVLRVADIPKLAPNADDVLVRVHAAGLNPRDSFFREGANKVLMNKTFPKQTGSDFSGVIETVGNAVTEFSVGESVYGYLEWFNGGALAEYVAVPAKWISRKPFKISHEEAAAMPCTYLTALQALRDKTALKPGERVLIYGASGGVGTAATQLAHHIGAQVWTVSHSRNQDYCVEQGADRAIGYDQLDVFRLGEDFDVFLQLYSKDGDVFKKAKKIMRKRGRFVAMMPSPKAVVKAAVSRLLPGPAYDPMMVKARTKDLQYLAALIAEGSVRPQVMQTFTPDTVQDAFRKLDEGHTRGKLVITIP